MKNLLIGSLVLLAIWSCSNSHNKNSVQHSDDVNQLLKKITNADFKAFAETFAIGKFPFDVSETPLFADGEVPASFHEMSLENVKKFNSDASENKGFYTGYAIYEENYVALIYFYSYSSLFGGLNYHTSANLLTFSFDGKLIGQILLGEANTSVNPNAKRESQKMEGSVYPDKTSIIKIGNYLEEEPNGSGNSLTFLIKPNGEIVRRDTVSVENKVDENPLTQYKQNLPSSEGLTPVRNKDDKWGYVNKDGKVFIECQYEGVSSFENGKAVVKIASDDDWQINYHYIDVNGNDLGLFFNQIDGTSCAEASVTISDIGLEQTNFLSNCPDGVRSVNYRGDEGSSGETFYPNVNIEQLITNLANTDNEFGPIYKKFDGNSLEFKDGDFNISITVNKNAEGIVTSIDFSKNYHSMGTHITFEPKETGVMVSERSGS